MAMQCEKFTIRQVGTTGHEILDPDGRVVTSAVDEPWALSIAGLLNRVEANGLDFRGDYEKLALEPKRRG
jgi:hypothetical protein